MTKLAFSVGIWTAAAIGAGFALVVTLAALAAGYILGGFVLARAGRTVMGTHVRHFFTNIAPAKRFDPTDRELVIKTIQRAIEDGRIIVSDAAFEARPR